MRSLADLASATAVTLHLRFAVDHFAPPASAGMRCLQVDPFTHHRRGNPYAVFGGQFEYPFERLVPGMHGQVEGAVVDRQQPAPAKIPVSLEGLLRVHVHVRPMFNALRHTAAGTRVELAVETAQGCARFHVRDHGPGIAETDLPHLTRRFWRHGKSGGSGLGLAIVQAIVQRCQCRLDFDSRADGLRVTLEMPLRK